LFFQYCLLFFGSITLNTQVANLWFTYKEALFFFYLFLFVFFFSWLPVLHWLFRFFSFFLFLPNGSNQKARRKKRVRMDKAVFKGVLKKKKVVLCTINSGCFCFCFCLFLFVFV